MRIQYQNPRDYVDLLLCSELTFGMYQDKRRKNNFYANTLLLDQKVFKKSRLTLSLCELPTTKIHFGFGNNANSTFHSTNESRPQALWILAAS